MTLFLDEVEEDAFKELFNLSFGATAATLSEMVDAEIKLSVPSFLKLPPRSLLKQLHGLFGDSIGLVGMRYRFIFRAERELPGMAVLLVRAADLRPFLEALHGDAIPSEMIGQIEADSMQLAGDVLLYTCASTLSALLASDIDCQRPFFFRGESGSLSEQLGMEGREDGQELLMLRVDFQMTGKGVSGSLLTWMDDDGLPFLKAEIDHFIVTHMS
ncbi:MAG: hypothetical protein HQL86_00935 [Magnetococcales bacterium]|nr:hypothetical protein [Magnetococcales bacterium]